MRGSVGGSKERQRLQPPLARFRTTGFPPWERPFTDDDEKIGSGKYINLDPHDRFVDTATLRDAYLREPGVGDASLPPYVTLKTKLRDKRSGVSTDVELELGIVDATHPVIARAVSSLLSRSLEDARDSNGGYLPGPVVDRVQRILVSPHGIAHGWGPHGFRFVLSRAGATARQREIVASALVARDDDTIFFFTGRYNNVPFSRLAERIDLSLSADGDPGHRWFDKFRFPSLDCYKPRGYHHIANFVVEREGNRGLGLSRLLVESIVDHYTERGRKSPVHSQPRLSGLGFWQIGDPPWLARMSALGFQLRLGAESFHVDVPWDPLPTTKSARVPSDPISYNEFFGLPYRYSDLQRGISSPWTGLYEASLRGRDDAAVGYPLIDRIASVIETARSGVAKLQYIQVFFPFERKEALSC